MDAQRAGRDGNAARTFNGTELAVVGLAARLPSAPNVASFWEALKTGADLVTDLTIEEILTEGLVPEAVVRSDRYVPSAALLDEFDRFDAEFFGISAAEASRTDPQQRLLLEASWRALEDAGYAGETHAAIIGVFASTSPNTYLLNNLIAGSEGVAGQGGDLSLLVGNEKDFAASRVAYRLGLSGPAVTVQTACSSGLSALHLAARSLQAHDCDIAVVAASSVRVPQRAGYVFQDGAIFSRTGRCRAFDAKSDGCVPASGVVSVVLRRWTDAQAAGDRVDALLLSTAVNNDGNRKAGFAAPGIDGQAEVITTAHALAEVGAEDVCYVEAHGTGTRLGDPVEAAALRRVFRGTAHPVGIGALKSNVGHLDSAAGLAGFVKAVLAVRHRSLPPTPHFRQLNPAIDFSGTGLHIVDEPRAWPDPLRRICGVSSFGVGGTNAHAVLMAAPAQSRRPREEGPAVLPLSSSRPNDLPVMLGDLAHHLRRNPSIRLADVAHTLQWGRPQQEHRAAVVAENVEMAINELDRLANGGEPISARDDLGIQWERWVSGGPTPRRTSHDPSPARRVSLPGAVLHPTRHWVDAPPQRLSPQHVLGSTGSPARPKAQHPAPKFNLREHTWSQRPTGFGSRQPVPQDALRVVIHDGGPVGRMLALQLADNSGVSELVIEDPKVRDLPDQLRVMLGGEPSHIVLLCTDSARRAASEVSREAFERGRPRAFDLPLALADALSRAELSCDVGLDLVTSGRFNILGGELVDISQWLVESARLVLPSENSHVRTRTWDLPSDALWSTPSSILARLANELAQPGDGCFAVRGTTVWRRDLTEVTDPPVAGSRLVANGVVLVTGGLGGIGAALTKRIARENPDSELHLLVRPTSETSSANHVTADRALVHQLTADAFAAGIFDSFNSVPGLVESLERACALRIVEYWRGLGLPVHRGVEIERLEIIRATRARPKMHRMIDFQIRVLVEDGLLSSKDGRLIWTAEPPPEGAGNAELDRVRRLDPRTSELVDLLDHCIAHYPQALSGDIEPIAVLYPKGRTDLMGPAAIAMLERSSGTACCLTVASLAATMAARSEHPLRILEVGAGNGLLTERLLHALAEQAARVTVTDVGRSLVDGLAQRFSGLGVEFATLDITDDPVAQGFELETFDLVIGLNVVHATPHVVETTEWLRRLLTPGGVLALVESVRRERWVDMVAGLAEDWWAFADGREESPLLSVDQWTEVFRRAGLDDVVGLPDEDVCLTENIDCAVLLGTRPVASSGAATESRTEELRTATRPTPITFHTADLRHRDSTASALDDVWRTYGAPSVLLHCAGRIAGALVRNLTHEACEVEFGARVYGLLTLLEGWSGPVRSDAQPPRLLLSSSLNTVHGGAGQFAYVAANAALAGVAEAWRSRGGEASVIHWDRWRDVGLGRTFERRYGRLAGHQLTSSMDADDAVAGLAAALELGLRDFAVIAGLDEQASECGAQEQRTMDYSVAPATTSPSGPTGSAARQATAFESALLDFCRSVLHLPALAGSQPLLDAGADSLDVLELQAELEESFGISVYTAALMTEPLTRIAAACMDPSTATSTLEVLDAALLSAAIARNTR